LNIQKILDSNILIYSILEGHPASTACEQLILSSEGKFIWATSPITFYETFHVLVKIYNQPTIKVISKIDEIMKLPINIISLNSQLTISSLEKCVKHSIDTNDSLLLEIAIRQGIPIIATDDKKLINVCNEYGIICENPITEEIRKNMSEWEKENLPEKGLGRIYFKVYDWISKKDEKIAKLFKTETNEFSRSL